LDPSQGFVFDNVGDIHGEPGPVGDGEELVEGQRLKALGKALLFPFQGGGFGEHGDPLQHQAKDHRGRNGGHDEPCGEGDFGFGEPKQSRIQGQDGSVRCDQDEPGPGEEGMEAAFFGRQIGLVQPGISV